MKDLRIGVFDSGVGGLTVLRELIRHVPEADYLYFGDTARLPYGSKSAETVARYAVGAAHFLQERGMDMLVVACNTATALALDAVTAGVTVPVIGVVDPGALHAASSTSTKSALVIGTEATIASHAYQRALATRGVNAHEKACPLFVPLVEEGWVDHPVTEQVARIYVGEAVEEARENGHCEPDVLVLGCTHYPLIRALLKRVVPEGVAIVDSAESTACVVSEQIGRARESCSDSPTEKHVKCFVTDSVEKFRRLGSRFLGQPLGGVEHVDLGG